LDHVVSRRTGIGALLAWTLGASLLIFAALQAWRPCYFLTDDNLSGLWPVVIEIGRHLQAGQSPFVSDYLFGGHYNQLRDISCQTWHPLVLGLSLLADTPAQFWIMDILALILLLLATAGFTVLAWRLRKEFSLPIPDAYLIFYTLSFVFSTFILTVGPGWIEFLASQSCLPWLTLGILDTRPLRGSLLIAVFTIHELLLGYLGLLVSISLCLSILALLVAVARRSICPVFCWAAGSLLGILLLSPLLLATFDGFAHTSRVHGMTLDLLTVFSIPPATFLSSFFLGNWAELIARGLGDKYLVTMQFPYLPMILACPAAWCLWPALFTPGRWRYLEKICLGLALFLVVLIIRPYDVAVVMQHLPVFRSLRWPFREGLLFLFFIHVFLVVRFRVSEPRWQFAATAIGLLLFLLPLPFIRVPSLNPLKADRQLLFSGRVQQFWRNVKTKLQPGDQIATVVDVQYWVMHGTDMPYSLMGTASFPAYLQLPCIAGYSVTAPIDQLPIKTVPYFWYGAFRPEQVNDLLAERPNIKLIRLESVDPLKITMSTGNGPEIDLTPLLPP
jgi:hypothetical protein